MQAAHAVMSQQSSDQCLPPELALMTAEMPHVASAQSGLLLWADSHDKTTTTVHIKVATRRCQPSLASSRHLGRTLLSLAANIA